VIPRSDIDRQVCEICGWNLNWVPSRSVPDAFALAEKMRNRFKRVTIEMIAPNMFNVWIGSTVSPDGIGSGTTFPEAMCKATIAACDQMMEATT
jgi:hypothetical protein